MLPEDFSKYRIILASRSPRRQQLLTELGLAYEVRIIDYEESYPEGLNGEEISLFIARDKALHIKHELTENEIGITADTVVWCNEKVLGKPVDYDDAISILREISGNTHEVITGVCIFSPAKEVTFTVSTMVEFAALSDEEMHYYVERYKPYDKAGGYGIQEWIGLAGCSRIEGSYSNVVGLPVHRLYMELKKFINE